MCAITAAKRKRRVLVLENANKAGKKILMSGGGRCNFTNYTIEAENYISNNPHFCKSALSRYTQWDFIALIEQYKIPYHERDHGQLFCNESSRDVLNMLLAECQKFNVEIRLNEPVKKIQKTDSGFQLLSVSGQNQYQYQCASLVVATGGLSIPKMGATPFGYQIAEQFDIPVCNTAAGLVPFTLQPQQKQQFSALTGIAVPATVSNDRQQFRENLLFTHRGLSGPSILQISSYWRPGEHVTINLLPDIDLKEELKRFKSQHPKKALKTVLADHLPRRVLETFIDKQQLDQKLAHLSHEQFDVLSDSLHHWRLKPNATEGYRTAEVTLGGVDCNALSSKTMQCINQPGLFFIGEVIDVTGWLGGYNFQWAWSSGWCAGQYV